MWHVTKSRCSAIFEGKELNPYTTSMRTAPEASNWVSAIPQAVQHKHNDVKWLLPHQENIMKINVDAACSPPSAAVGIIMRDW